MWITAALKLFNSCSCYLIFVSINKTGTEYRYRYAYKVATRARMHARTHAHTHTHTLDKVPSGTEQEQRQTSSLTLSGYSTGLFFVHQDRQRSPEKKGKHTCKLPVTWCSGSRQPWSADAVTGSAKSTDCVRFTLKKDATQWESTCNVCEVEVGRAYVQIATSTCTRRQGKTRARNSSD